MREKKKRESERSGNRIKRVRVRKVAMVVGPYRHPKLDMFALGTHFHNASKDCSKFLDR